MRCALAGFVVLTACGRVGFDARDDGASSTLCSDLVAHFKLDETAGTSVLDSVSQVSASVQGGVAFDPGGGIVGGAATFDGTGYIDVTRTQDFPVADFSWTVWLRPTNLVNRTLFNLRNPALTLAFHLKWATATDLEFILNGVDVLNGVPGFDMTWQQVAITRTGSATTVYRNGVMLRATTDASIIDIQPTCVFRIGAITECSGATAGVQHWIGQLDELRAYRRGLSAAEVEELYQTSLAGQPPAC